MLAWDMGEDTVIWYDDLAPEVRDRFDAEMRHSSEMNRYEFHLALGDLGEALAKALYLEQLDAFLGRLYAWRPWRRHN